MSATPPDASPAEESDLLRLTPEQQSAWHDFFERGEAFVALTDGARVERLLRGNTRVLTGVAIAFAACPALIVALNAAHAGRPITYILIAIFLVALCGMGARIWFARRRLRSAQAAPPEYLVVTASGIRVVGLFDVPWREISLVLGFDDGGITHRYGGAQLARWSGVSAAELWLSHAQVRQLREAAPRAHWPLFEVIEAHGAIRIPLDTVVPAGTVRQCLAAVAIAASHAGSEVVLTNNRAAIARTARRMMANAATVTGPGQAPEPTA